MSLSRVLEAEAATPFWSASERKKLELSIFRLTVSPNTYFAFTPLLASASVGTIEYDACLEPVRRWPVTFHQAWCDEIDLQHKRIKCMPAIASDARKAINARMSSETDDTLKPAMAFPGADKGFELGYDKLVIAVGAYSQTFGTEGVKEYATFLKDVRVHLCSLFSAAVQHHLLQKSPQDARKIRSRILECFELASLPTVNDQERKNLLHFVIVGGGPTGVEFAGELHDLITSDIQRAYPKLAPLARISIYDVAPGILGTFDKSLAEYASAKFKREGIALKTSRHVKSVGESYIEVQEEGKVPFGLLVWSTGLAPNPLIQTIKDLQHDEKTHSLRVNDQFNAIGMDGKVHDDIFVLGDASALKEKLPATAQVASQEARWLAKHLNAQARGRAGVSDPFAFNNRGPNLYLGLQRDGIPWRLGRASRPLKSRIRSKGGSDGTGSID
ncbi:SPOSA6832_01729, partial [Sporobolomyces salmonicolor]